MWKSPTKDAALIESALAALSIKELHCEEFRMYVANHSGKGPHPLLGFQLLLAEHYHCHAINLLIDRVPSEIVQVQDIPGIYSMFLLKIKTIILSSVDDLKFTPIEFDSLLMDSVTEYTATMQKHKLTRLLPDSGLQSSFVEKI